MRIDIFDVGHGHCSVVTAPNGRRIMLDCGDRWGEDRFWTPSLHYLGQTIDLLTVLNVDEDHLSDFKSVTGECNVGRILSNPTIGPREFTVLKKEGMRSGARAFADWLAAPKWAPTALPPLDFGFVAGRWYSNSYDLSGSNNTNDLSLVVIVQFSAFKIVFAGDLEVAGWRRLLARPEFRLDLIGTTIFVASHHGRKSGCCTELFDLMRPQIVVISDDERQYDSQDTDDWYRNRCSGASCIANPFERRYVMTTRKDGSMRIDVGVDGSRKLIPVTVRDWPRAPVARTPSYGLSGAVNDLFPSRSAQSYGLSAAVSDLFPSRSALDPTWTENSVSALGRSIPWATLLSKKL
jgi:beta-lactamase superfamily II metal-dependent hydrolase